MNSFKFHLDRAVTCFFSEIEEGIHSIGENRIKAVHSYIHHPYKLWVEGSKANGNPLHFQITLRIELPFILCTRESGHSRIDSKYGSARFTSEKVLKDFRRAFHRKD